MVTTKTVLRAIGLLLAFCGSVPVLYAQQSHKQKFTLQPAGYYFKSAYEIQLLSHPHTRPLKVKLWIGRVSPYILTSNSKSTPSIHRGPKTNYHKGNFAGQLTFAIDKKHAYIAFDRNKQKKLQLKAENIASTSLWHTPLHKILENVWRYDQNPRKKNEQSHMPHTPVSAPFSIRPDTRVDNYHELDATYVVRSKSKPFSSFSRRLIYTIIQPKIDRHNKTRGTRASVIFYQHKDCRRCVMYYNVTKKGLCEIETNITHTYLKGIAKKAAEKSVMLYFKLLNADKKLCTIYKNNAMCDFSLRKSAHGENSAYSANAFNAMCDL